MPVMASVLTAWLSSCLGTLPAGSPADSGAVDTGAPVASTPAPETVLVVRPASTLDVFLDTVLCEGDELVVQTLGHADAVWADGFPLDADPVEPNDPWRTFRLAGACDAAIVEAWRDNVVVDRRE